MNNTLHIGVDFGGVCSSITKDYEDGKAFVDTINVDANIINIENCAEVLREIIAAGHKIALISFCGKTRAKVTRKALSTHYPDIFNVANMWFVKKRRDKNALCKFLGLDLMIDDKLSIVESITCTTPVLFTGDPTYDQDSSAYKGLIANSWNEVLNIVNATKPLALEPDQKIKAYSMCY